MLSRSIDACAANEPTGAGDSYHPLRCPRFLGRAEFNGLCWIWLAASLVVIGCGQRQLTKLDQAKQLSGRGQPKKALRLCNELLQEDPRDFDALLLRGQVYRDTGDLTNALEDANALVAIDQRNYLGYELRYRVYLQLAERAESTDSSASAAQTDEKRNYEWLASQDFQRYFALNPDAKEAGFNALVPMKAPFTGDELIEPLPELLADQEDGIETEVPEDFAEAFRLDNELDAGDDPEAALADKNGDAETGEDSTPNTNNEWLANRSQSGQQIREADLDPLEHLPEPTLPPHEDGNEQELPDVPAPPIVRFDLPPAGLTTLPTSRATPRAHTTGIVPPTGGDPSSPDSSRPWTAPVQLPTGLSPWVSATPTHTTGIPYASGSPHTTGIVREQRSSQTAMNQVVQPRTYGSPWFTPQPAPLRPTHRLADGDEPKSDKTDKPAQVLSMALPNTAPGPTNSVGTSLGLLPPPWYTPSIPTTGSVSTAPSTFGTPSTFEFETP